MSEERIDVYGGVDTHRDVHVAAVVDTAGRVLGSAPFGTDPAGYEQMNNWLRSHGLVIRVGVEGAGSYGAGLTRHLTRAGVEVVEVNRPNRQLRRRLGKTDTTDAQGAARAALNGQATARPKSRNGPVEGIRMLGTARRSAVKARTQAINQLHALAVTAPEQVKHQLEGLNPKARVKTCAGFRPRTDDTTTFYAKKTLRHLARRYQALTTEIEELDTGIHRLCARANPALLAATGVGAAQRGRRPPSQQCSLADRHHPHAMRPDHHRLRPKTPNRRQNPPGDHPLPQTPHRPPDPPPSHQPTTNTQRRPPTHPTPNSPHHPHPRRPSAPHPPKPPLTTRTRPLPQPPTRHPIPTLANRTHTTTKPNLTKIGASPIGVSERGDVGVLGLWGAAGG